MANTSFISAILFSLLVYITTCGACHNGYVRFENSCYHISSGVQNWVDAMYVCKLDNAYLAEIESVRENSFLKTLVSGHSVSNAWIGGADLDVEGDWLWWTSKARLAYTNWKPGEPNNDGVQNCMSIKTGGVWDDGSCNHDLRYICEMPLSI